MWLGPALEKALPLQAVSFANEPGVAQRAQVAVRRRERHCVPFSHKTVMHMGGAQMLAFCGLEQESQNDLTVMVPFHRAYLLLTSLPCLSNQKLQ